MYNYFFGSRLAKGIMISLLLSLYAFAQPVPVPSTPLNGSLIYYNSPLISWYFNESSIGLTYQLQVSVVSDFSTVLVDTANLPTTSYIFNAESGTQYFWRVRSFRGAAASAWCTTFSFSTTGTPPSYSITSAAGAHGTISPLGATTVSNHGTQSYTITPASGYHVKDVVVDGVSKGALTSYTFTNVTTNHTINAYFSDLWFVTSSAGPHGTISPNGVDSVANGGSITYTAAADLHYHLAAIKVDDTVVSTSSPYTLSTISANHTVKAEFAIDTYAITATGMVGGTISPAGVTNVNYGDTLKYTITPDAGYKIIYVVVDGVLVGNVSTYTFASVTTTHNIQVGFAPYHTFYVSVAGNDATGDGSAAKPFKTILNTLISCGPNGDVINVGDGLFPETVPLSIPNLSIIGSANTYLYGATIGADNVTLKNVNLNGVLAGVTQAILNPTGISHKNVTIDNVKISNYVSGIYLYNIAGLNILNVSISASTSIGCVISNTTDLVMNNITVTNSAGPGILLKGIHGINIDKITCNNNSTSPTAIYDGGLVLNGVFNGTISNVTTNLNGNTGLYVGISDNITFTNITSNRNALFGIFVISDPIVGDPYPPIVPLPTPSITNLKIGGSVTLTSNMMSGLFLMSSLASSILGPVFDGQITINDTLTVSGNPAVVVAGNVVNPVFKGFKVKYVNPAFSILSAITATNQPVGVKINNCVFYMPGGAPTIVMSGTIFGGMPGSCNNPVDARYNTFLNATDLLQIEAMTIDSVESHSLGRVDVTGAAFGFSPMITLNGKTAAYKGASYYLSVDLKPAGNDYYWLRGAISYDTTKLQYLGYLNNGLINSATWYLNMYESPKGKINYTAYGVAPINANGSLFMLNMKILSTATGASTSLAGNPLEFYGNLTQGVFGIITNTINYSNPTGVLQTKGDVTLDGVVNDDDFYALLMHVNGVIPLTAPQALLNADFDSNGHVNMDDVNALFAFLHPSPAPSSSAPAAKVKFGNITYNKDGSATIPIAINGASNVASFELAMTYDASKVDYQAFSSSVNLPGYFVQAFKTGEGKAKFVFNAQNSIQGNFNSGDVTLRFKNSSVPVGSIVQTNYTLNGKVTMKGPDFKFGQDGVTYVTTEKQAVPTEYTLYQNYPNPFNPSTTISYYIPDASDVKVVVYDMMGKVVKELVNSRQDAGQHSVVWNADNNELKKVANGIYFYRINAGSFNSVKKMILLK